MDSVCTIDMVSQDNHSKSMGAWETPIVRDEAGKPIGAVLTLTIQDISELGLEIESEDTLFYYITDGKILIRKTAIADRK